MLLRYNDPLNSEILIIKHTPPGDDKSIILRRFTTASVGILILKIASGNLGLSFFS